MKKFSDFGTLARHLGSRLPHVEAAQKAELEAIAEHIEGDAKAKIGEYQGQAGPFGAWAPLADSTLADKARKGWSPPDNPLLRTGDLRASYAHIVEGLEAIVGSPLQLAVWQELGTHRIPPRPVIGPAAYDMRDAILMRITVATLRGFKGGI